MDKFIINGPTRLEGTVATAAAKNAVLPILAACLLTEEPCTIRDVPLLEDVRTMARLLRSLGVQVEQRRHTVKVAAAGKIERTATYDIVRKMRASYYVLGPLLGRFGDVRVSLPGGCAIGPRPIDLHLKGVAALGADVDLEHGYIHATGRLRGGTMLLEGSSGPSVGATANTMMAAVLADGETVIQGAACEPEVSDLAGFLIAMGAKIEGCGTPAIRIKGVKRLHGTNYRPIPDRIRRRHHSRQPGNHRLRTRAPHVSNRLSAPGRCDRRDGQTSDRSQRRATPRTGHGCDRPLSWLPD
jgi:UDP-N-acetylglucosamine 1-carboxyvinyltransferase